MANNDELTYSKYLPHNDRDILWQLYCTTLGMNKIPAGSGYPPGEKKHPPEYRSVGSTGRVLNEFQFVYISSGKGKFKTKTEEYGIQEGIGFLVFPGVWHWYAPDTETGWDEYWVGFTGEYGENLLRNDILSVDRPVLDVGINPTIVHLFQEMFEIAKREPPGFQPKLTGSVIRLLAHSLSFDQQRSHGSETEQLVQRARMVMEDYVFNNLEMEKISNQLSMSYTQFRTMFKDYTGQSPYQYYLNIKINKAKALLEAGEYNVKEVAYELGFENQYYFSRLFKKKTGVNPSCWNEACL